jgi:probable F420-dependent oxidoreductase
MRPFRFGLQVRGDSAAELRDTARAAEAAGFHVISTADHVSQGWAPLPPLLAMADCTTRLRVCPLVLNNDFHHPVHLAREVAAIDHLSGGRFELGIGAGHAFTEYAAIGQRFDPPATRKARMAEAIEIMRRLLGGEEVTFSGEHYRLDQVRTMPALQPRLPFLVAVSGKAALAHAARHADIVGLFGLGRTLPDGQRHEVRWQSARLDATVAYIREQAAERADELELNALVQRVVVTHDRRAAAEEIAASIDGLAVEDALETPFLALGTQAEIAEHLQTCRQRWGISYFTVRALEDFAPVIDRLSADTARLP